ncbi:hypothetical protein PSYRMG_15745 [Pseudomonas syringae UMAF0158]|nr:hypothetical protein PSYRMG_15745 [Pseudomonas syringae UMAF0158]
MDGGITFTNMFQIPQHGLIHGAGLAIVRGAINQVMSIPMKIYHRA